MPRKKRQPRHEALPVDLPQSLLDNAANYSGNARKLEAAIGAYVIGQMYGWRTIYMIHTQEHCRELEEIIGGRFVDLCEERTSLTGRSVGIRLADQLGSFWRVAKGKGHQTIRAVLGADEAAGSQGTLL